MAGGDPSDRARRERVSAAGGGRPDGERKDCVGAAPGRRAWRRDRQLRLRCGLSPDGDWHGEASPGRAAARVRIIASISTGLTKPAPPATMRELRARLSPEFAHAGAFQSLPVGPGCICVRCWKAWPPRQNETTALRDRLRLRVEQRGSAWLHRVLQRLDPQAAALIHANDVPKLIRSIEVTLAARQPQTEQWQAGRDALRGYRVLQMGLAPTASKPFASGSTRASMIARQRCSSAA